MLAGHQSGAARTTRHARHVRLCEPRAFLGQPIQSRRLRIRMPIATEIAVTQVISENENDVGFLRRICMRGKEARQNECDIPNHAAAALRAFLISALVFSEPSIGSMPPPSNSIEMTPE